MPVVNVLHKVRWLLLFCGISDGWSHQTLWGGGEEEGKNGRGDSTLPPTPMVFFLQVLDLRSQASILVCFFRSMSMGYGYLAWDLLVNVTVTRHLGILLLQRLHEGGQQLVVTLRDSTGSRLDHHVATFRLNVSGNTLARGI